MARDSNRRIGRSKKGRIRSAMSGRYVVTRKSFSEASGRYVVIGSRGGKTSGSGAGKERGPYPEPRSGLFHGDDPTLAKRAEEELNNIAR